MQIRRDYRAEGSVAVRQMPRAIKVIGPDENTGLVMVEVVPSKDGKRSAAYAVGDRTTFCPKVIAEAYKL